MTKDEFLTAALRNPANRIIADELRRLALPDAWVVAGCLTQTVWNAMTGRAADYGISDYDVFYFDPDTSWEAEDKVIRRLSDALMSLRVEIETRNQARVHLWYPSKHGLPYPPLSRSTDGIDRFFSERPEFRRCFDIVQLDADPGLVPGPVIGLVRCDIHLQLCTVNRVPCTVYRVPSTVYHVP